MSKTNKIVFIKGVNVKAETIKEEEEEEAEKQSSSSVSYEN